jgi:anthranilate phosphoribosyltransferase
MKVSASGQQQEAVSVEAAIELLCAGESLSEGQAESLFSELVAGRLAEPQLAGLLVALKAKGEHVDEIVGAVRALRRVAEPFPRPDYPFADTCGTGGDKSGTINVSTAVAFVVAACGLPVVKHGNRSMTSQCGSADVLERLGARIDLAGDAARQVLDQAGICFLFAQLYHPSLRHAGPVRRALGIRTIFNMLGPCLNPASPPVQLVGVADPKLIDPVAATLSRVGVARALVVHGSGLDEIALHGPTEAVLVRDGELERLTFSPEQAGLSGAPLATLAGGDPDENARRLRELLSGGGSEAEQHMVAINAGALLMIAGLASDLRAGSEAALAALANGGARERLNAFVEASNA